jgi:hypothetical protein
MNRLNLKPRFALVAALALAPAALAANPPQLELEKEGVQMIRQVEEVARDVRYNAARLNSLANSLQASRWSVDHHVSQIRELVNDGLNPALRRLIELQPLLPDWKQQSIDRLLASAKTLAADTNDAILTRNEAGPAPLAMNAEFRSFVTRVYQHAESLVKTSDAAGSYAAARFKAHSAGVKVPQS